MPRMPGAEWRPLPNPSRTGMARYDLVVIHTMVGSLSGTDGYFRRLTNGVNSHFGTGGGGEIWQWVDTAVRSGANGDGNHRAITVENADMGPGFPSWNTNDASQVPAFTPAQIEANARICAWAHKTHGVPLVAAQDSLPGTRGIGFHRLGCDPYRVAGGERWSSSYGKVCPGSRRIAQIPQIIARARQLAGGAPIEEGFMPALNDAQQTELYNKVNYMWQTLTPGKGGYKHAGPAFQELVAARAEIAALRAALAADRGIDPVALEGIVRKAVADSIVTVDVNVNNPAQ